MNRPAVEPGVVGPHIIYPHGGIVDLLPSRSHSGRSIYGLQFDSGIVKVGQSRHLKSRLDFIVKRAATIGISPTRFFISPPYQNASRVETAILTALRAECAQADVPEDFTGSTEWFANCSIERVLELAENWLPVASPYGYPVAMLTSEIRAKRSAETGVHAVRGGVA